MASVVEKSALAAVTAVVSACGLDPSGAVVVHSESNVLVRFPAGAAVARVMTGTVVLHDEPRRWLEREISVLEFLASSGLAVLPSRLIQPGPHARDGLWMTFTEWIPDVEPVSLQDAGELGRTLRALHDQLRRFDGELGGFRDLGEDIGRLLDQLRAVDDHENETISSLRDRLDELRRTVFASNLPAQALHGDVSLRNLFRTPRGLVWNDFEDTFRGPVHWDVASYVGSLRIQGANERQVQEMLDAYGWADEQDLSPFFNAQDLYDEIWQMYDTQRRRHFR